MEIDILTVFHDPKLRFNISYLVQREILEALNSLFKDFDFTYSKVILSLGASSEISGLKRIDKFKTRKKDTISIAYVLPHKHIVKQKHYEVNVLGNKTLNLELTHTYENSYDISEYLNIISKILYTELHLEKSSNYSSELDNILKTLSKKFTSSYKYNYINQVEQIIENMNFIKLTPESKRTNYDIEQFNLYHNSYVKFTEQVKFDKDGYLIPPK